jgi:hypothetical protein
MDGFFRDFEFFDNPFFGSVYGVFFHKNIQSLEGKEVSAKTHCNLEEKIG